MQPHPTDQLPPNAGYPLFYQVSSLSFSPADDKTVVVDDQFSGTVDKDDDTDVLVYRFSKNFPEIKKHAEAYEAEIAKLIANQDIDTETVLVEYRDI